MHWAGILSTFPAYVTVKISTLHAFKNFKVVQNLRILNVKWFLLPFSMKYKLFVLANQDVVHYPSLLIHILPMHVTKDLFIWSRVSRLGEELAQPYKRNGLFIWHRVTRLALPFIFNGVLRNSKKRFLLRMRLNNASPLASPICPANVFLWKIFIPPRRVTRLHKPNSRQDASYSDVSFKQCTGKGVQFL